MVTLAIPGESDPPARPVLTREQVRASPEFQKIMDQLTHEFELSLREQRQNEREIKEGRTEVGVET